MNLGFDVSQLLKPYAKNRFLLAVSGGSDSMALFHVFLHLKKHLNYHFGVAHFHHGPSLSREQQAYRFQAHDFVKAQCRWAQVDFFSNFNQDSEADLLAGFGEPLQSEAQFREHRYNFLQETLSENNFDYLVLAHHSLDVLETLLLKMIRGVGPQGFEPMTLLKGTRLRPLISYKPEELKAYLQSQDLKWIDDPSNDCADESLRNWIRQQWLPDLEERSPGALTALHRSLDLLVDSQDAAVDLETFVDERGFNLTEWQVLLPVRKRAVMAAYMKSQNLKNFGFSHINEVIKRLDSEKKSHSFNLLGRRWNVDAGRMSLVKPS